MSPFFSGFKYSERILSQMEVAPQRNQLKLFLSGWDGWIGSLSPPSVLTRALKGYKGYGHYQLFTMARLSIKRL